MSRPLRLLAFLYILPWIVPSLAFGEHVSRVIDGDTIQLSSGERVRYIGIDTPETVHPSKPVEFMGKEASDFNQKLVEGRNVRLEYDIEKKDRYGRLLAYVFLDTLFVNAELIREGYAQVLTIPPNVKYADFFLGLQREARNNELGLWNESASQKYTSRKPKTDSGKYYITRTGKKYHQGGCRYLSKSAIEITMTEAENRGYGPCSVCLRGTSTSGRTSTRAPASSGRCQATTKKGTQCKRNAKAGSSYCWQH